VLQSQRHKSSQEKDAGESHSWFTEHNRFEDAQYF